MYIRVEFDENPNVKEELVTMQELSNQLVFDVVGELNGIDLLTWPGNINLIAQYNLAARSQVIKLERVL